jgi:hypothetical protein
VVENELMAPELQRLPFGRRRVAPAVADEGVAAEQVARFGERVQRGVARRVNKMLGADAVEANTTEESNRLLNELIDRPP